MNCLTVTYRPIGSGVQLFVSLSQLLYNLTHVTIINDLLTYNSKCTEIEPGTADRRDTRQRKITEFARDARCCSPGHTAKYGYNMMDMYTGKILDVKIVQVCFHEFRFRLV